MARPTKTGMDYFPMDVDFLADDKVRTINNEFGARGVVVLIGLICRVFRSGYFLAFGINELKLFARYEVSMPMPLVDKILKACLEVGLFDKNLYNKHIVLTSAGIQRRYFHASTKRSLVNLNKELILIDLNVYKDSKWINSEITQVNPELIQEKKEKEIGKEIIESKPIKKMEDFFKDISVIEEVVDYAESLKVTEEKVVILLETFKRDKMQAEYASRRDMKNHFINWARKNLNCNSNNRTTISFGQKSQQSEHATSHLIGKNRRK